MHITKFSRFVCTTFFVLLFASVLSMTAFANSSWIWFTETKPYNLLPVVIPATLLIEIISINYIPGVRSLPRVIPIVTLANLVSFLLPYFSLVFGDKSFFESFYYFVNHTPCYTVCLRFLILTLLLETPVVYFSLKKKAKNRKVLLIVILSANAVTTAICAVVEHVVCRGTW